MDHVHDPGRSTSKSSARSAPDRSASSEGFSTTVLPPRSAALVMPVQSANGKLNGPITPKTPNGFSTERLRSFGESLPELHLPAAVLVDVRAVGLDQVDGLFDLRDRLDPRLADLRRHRGGSLDPALGDPVSRPRAAAGRAPPSRAHARRAARHALPRRASSTRARGASRARLDAPSGARVVPVERLTVLAPLAGDDVRHRGRHVAAHVLELALELGVELGGARSARVRQACRHGSLLPSSRRRVHRQAARLPGRRHLAADGRRHPSEPPLELRAVSARGAARPAARSEGPVLRAPASPRSAARPTQRSGPGSGLPCPAHVDRSVPP